MSVQIISFRCRQERKNVCMSTQLCGIVCTVTAATHFSSCLLLILCFYLSVSSASWQSHVNSIIQHERRWQPNRPLMVMTNTSPCHPTVRAWRWYAGTGTQTHGWTHRCAHTHILLITQVTGSRLEHSKLPFPPLCVDTEPPGYALKIHLLCVPVLSRSSHEPTPISILGVSFSKGKKRRGAYLEKFCILCLVALCGQSSQCL